MVFRFLFLTLIVFYFFTGCDQNRNQVLPKSTGKPLEMIVVADSVVWFSGLNDAVESVFLAEHPGLPQREPLFSLYFIDKRHFEQIFKTTRSILYLEIDPSLKKPKFALQHDVWAKPQLVVNIFAPNVSDLIKILNKNQSKIAFMFRDFEVNLQIEELKERNNVKIYKEIKSQWGHSPLIPIAFLKATEKKDFFWFRRDRMVGDHEILDGFFYYKTPYLANSDWHLKSIIHKRDSVLNLYVHGRLPNSFMATEKLYLPDTFEYKKGPFYVKEIRGLWRMINETMGGPFIMQVYLDTAANELYYVDAYLYAPYFDKRKFVLELEAVTKSMDAVEINLAD